MTGPGSSAGKPAHYDRTPYLPRGRHASRVQRVNARRLREWQQAKNRVRGRAGGPPATPYDLGCFWHGEEPIPDGAYLVCGECWHCYVTPADLVAAVATVRAELGLPAWAGDADAVAFCPLCAHDF